jgi:hypothetical protein
MSTQDKFHQLNDAEIEQVSGGTDCGCTLNVYTGGGFFFTFKVDCGLLNPQPEPPSPG